MHHSSIARVLRASKAATHHWNPALPLTSLARIQSFHTSRTCQTDGVYKALTEMRIRTPWIEALREAQNSSVADPEPAVKPDLTPKRMSDSYVSLVLPLAVSTPNDDFLLIPSPCPVPPFRRS